MSKRDFITLANLKEKDFQEIFRLSREIKKRRKRGEKIIPLLRGKFMGMIFEKPSTRTRVSFQVAIEELGGTAIYLSGKEMQLGRGETIADTARVLSRYLDLILIRTFGQERVEEMAEYATVPVINGLTDLLHPCQIISDLFTILEKRGTYQNLKIAYLGDGNNVCHSWIIASTILGLDLHIATPPSYSPHVEELKRRGLLGEKENFHLYEEPEKAIENAHIIYTDVWVSMGQKDEEERKKVFPPYQVNSQILSLASPDCLVMHCLPAHRGEEITEEVIDGGKSIVWDQAENRLHVQKGIILWVMGMEEAV